MGAIMTEAVHFAGISFAADFASARREDGTAVAFTRTERRLLAQLIGNAGGLCTRDQLLDIVTEPGSDVGDRNIDFLVARVRAKLGDPARRPVFIATRYGEGYVWIASRPKVMPATEAAFLVVGPVRRLSGRGEPGDVPLAFAEALTEALRAEITQERRVVLDADCPPADQFGVAVPEFQIELTFVEANGRTDCVSVLRHFKTAAVMKVRRDEDVGAPQTVDAAARDLMAALWLSLAMSDGRAEPDVGPMDLRIYEAGAPFVRDEASDLPPEVTTKDEAFPTGENFRRNETHLRRLLAGRPNDPVLRLMLAVNIHARYIADGWRFFGNSDPRAADEAEMRDLVLGALPDLMGSPAHVLSAAKLMHFLGPEYRSAALSLAEDAFRRATELAHALSILGAMRCHCDDFAGGLPLLWQARPLARPNTIGERYIVATICQHLMAAGDFEGKDRELQLLTRSPLSKGPFRLVFADPDEVEPSLPVRLTLRLLSAKYARAMLLWSYYTSARIYSGRQARENVIVGLAGHLRRRFGDAIILPEIAEAVPGIFAVRERLADRIG